MVRTYPGPWVVKVASPVEEWTFCDPREITATRSASVMEGCRGCAEDDPSAWVVSPATLIAAAPDLLAALEQLYERLHHDFGRGGMEGMLRDALDLRQIALDAIDKATGYEKEATVPDSGKG